MNSNARAIPRDHSDEIDLVELFQNLWEQKWLISAVTVVVTCLAAAFAFLTIPTYQSSAKVLPPRLSDIAGYNLGRKEAGLNEFRVQDVYAVFKLNLFSDSLKRELFREVYLPSLAESEASVAQDKLWQRFNEALKVGAPNVKNNPDLFEISLQHEDPQTAAEWVSHYLDMAAKRTEADMQRNLSTEIGTKARSLQQKIEVLRITAEKRRLDRIVRLREALQVAEAVGADAPQVRAGKTSSDGDLAEFMDGNLMYMRGAKAVRAELVVLEKREDQDPFIPELRGLENQLDFLRKVDIAPENVQVFTLDSAAEVSQTPIKPKKALILALGLVLGGMLGVFVALIRSMLAKRNWKVCIEES